MPPKPPEYLSKLKQRIVQASVGTKQGAAGAQVNPDQDSLQRLRLLRGEVDAPMRAPKPARTAQARPVLSWTLSMGWVIRCS